MNIYVAGPMDNCSPEYQTEWRQKVIGYFNLHNLYKEPNQYVKILDPCRRPHGADLTAREIYDLDLRDVRNSNIMLVDTRPIQRPSWGTAMEIMYAYEVCKMPIIGWNDGGNLGRRIFLDVTLTRDFNSLDLAIEHIADNYI